jgi:6-phosphogluconolactonase
MVAAGIAMTEKNVWNFLETRAEASSKAADLIANALRRRLGGAGRVPLILGGGSSPLACYSELAETNLEWNRVDVLASDERWVPAEHADSNERMLRETLLRDEAASANLLSYYRDEVTVAERCAEMSEVYSAFENPAACALLGMGEDGHFASLFPDAGNIEKGIDPDGTELFLDVSTAASPHERIGLTLAALLRADTLALLVFGEAKRAVLDTAMGDSRVYPVSYLLHQDYRRLHIFWAP